MLTRTIVYMLSGLFNLCKGTPQHFVSLDIHWYMKKNEMIRVQIRPFGFYVICGDDCLELFKKLSIIPHASSRHHHWVNHLNLIMLDSKLSTFNLL
jgi:hypothetical protein